MSTWHLRDVFPIHPPGLSPRRHGAAHAAMAGLLFGLASIVVTAGSASAAAPRDGVVPLGSRSMRGEVFLNGRWVSDSWCNATVPNPDGGPGGPGRSLCDRDTPHRYTPD